MRKFQKLKFTGRSKGHQMSLVIWTFPVLQIEFGPNPSFTGAEDPIFDGLHMSSVRIEVLMAGHMSRAEERTPCLPWIVTLDPAMD